MRTLDTTWGASHLLRSASDYGGNYRSGSNTFEIDTGRPRGTGVMDRLTPRLWDEPLVGLWLILPGPTEPLSDMEPMEQDVETILAIYTQSEGAVNTMRASKSRTTRI
jgi:hypothetical protein